MGRIGPRPPRRAQHPGLAGNVQDPVEDLLPGPGLNQAGPELTGHGVVEALIGEFQAQGVFPVDPVPHRLSRLPVWQSLSELQHRHQS